MFKKKTTPAPAKAKATRLPQAFSEAAREFERLKFDEIKKSRKVAWVVAGVSMFVTTVSIGAFLVALLLRTEPEPVVLRVDNTTGATTALRSIRDDTDKFDEVVNKYWLAQYVRTCEGYDWFLIGETFETCKLMSSDSIAKEYENKVKSPNSPLNVLKDKGKISVKVGSIVFVGETAQVRFTTEKVSPSGENTDQSPVNKWIATIAYEFQPRNMTEQQRLANPLGLSVAAYRVDPEVVK